MSTSRRDILAAAFSLTSLLAGCGGGGGGDPDPPAPAPAPPPAPPAPVTPPPPTAIPLPGSLALDVPAEADIGASVRFSSDLGAGREGLSFQWDFGDGATSTEPQPSHAYATRGDYAVRLAVRNAAGAAVSASTTLQAFLPLQGTGAPHFVDGQLGTAPAYDRMVILTADGGAHWRRMQTPYTQGQYSGGRVLFRDAMNGWAFESLNDITTVVRTTDGGRSWQTAGSANLVLIGSQPAFFHGTSLLLTGVQPGSVEQRSVVSTDGSTWRPAALAVTGAGRNGLVHGITDDGLQLSTDFGATARQVLGFGLSGNQPIALDLAEPGQLSVLLGRPASAAGGDYRPTLYTSIDGGRQWSEIPVATPAGVAAPGSEGRSVVIAGSRGWAAAHRIFDRAALFLRSDDGGRHWTTVIPPTVRPGLEQVPQVLDDATLALFLSGAGWWLSRDGGTSWAEVAVAGEPAQLLKLESAGGGVLRAEYGRHETPPGCGNIRCQQTIIERRYVSPDRGLTWHRLPGGQPI